MLTIEEIKKACEFADGFEYEKDNDMMQLPNGIRYYIGGGIDLRFIFDLREYKNILYRDFLQRVIEGINRGFEGLTNIRYYIVLESDVIQVFDIRFEGYLLKLALCDYNIVQAKTQAIKYILERI